MYCVFMYLISTIILFILSHKHKWTNNSVKLLLLFIFKFFLLLFFFCISNYSNDIMDFYRNDRFPLWSRVHKTFHPSSDPNFGNSNLPHCSIARSTNIWCAAIRMCSSWKIVWRGFEKLWSVKRKSWSLTSGC